MDNDTIGGLVALAMIGAIVTILVFGCQWNREHEIKKATSCYEQTKSNECWNIK